MAGKLVLRELSRYPIGTFADIIYRNALLYPDSEAFVCGSQRISFGSFNGQVNRIIHGLLGAGVRKGDVIGILSWNRLEYCEVFGAAMKGGFVLAHFSPRLKAEELLHVINDAEAKVLFLGKEFVEIVETIQEDLAKTEMFLIFDDEAEPMRAYRDLLKDQPAAEPDAVVNEDDPLVIFYTSGTTGLPRGAIYSQKQKMENTSMKALDIGVEFGDRHLVILPMFHTGGDSHIWPFFLMGGCNVIIPEPTFDPAAALKTIVDEQITDVHIVPTQLVALLNLSDIEGYDLGKLKRVWYAASPMPTEVLKRGLSVFGPVFIQGYGLTESGPHATVLNQASHRLPGSSDQDPGLLASCGQPCIGVQMRIIDEAGSDVAAGELGEIIIKSRRIMGGYWRNPDATDKAIKDGWLYTGDIGYYDEKGYIYIADRKKDMIVTGGENVYPKEVEEVLYRHPAVMEAAVIGIPDDYWVERVYALVVLRQGRQATAEEIIEFCKDHIAHYKAPKGVEFVDDLPKSPQGKILKKDIRKRYWKEK